MTAKHYISEIMNSQGLPEFICIGAQKAGTTALHDILSQHSRIFLPKDKEANFFDRDSEYIQGIDHWIGKHFNLKDPEKTCGVFTPDYLFDTRVPQRIKEAYGESGPKIIVILRNPVDRAFSHFLMSRRRGFETHDFQEAIKLENERIAKGEFELSHFSYLSRGHYADQINRYLTLFPREDFLFLCYENDLKPDPGIAIRKIEAFLGLKHEELDVSIRSNVASETYSKGIQKFVRGDGFVKRILKLLLGESFRRRMKSAVIRMNESKPSSYPKLSAEEKSVLMDRYFTDEIKDLESLTGLDLHKWKP